MSLSLCDTVGGFWREHDKLKGMTSSLGPASRRGVFQVGDKVQLTDAKGKMYTITLVENGWFNVDKGSFTHSLLIGQPEGTCVTSREGKEFIAFRPLHADYVLSMPRGATIVYPKDIGQIIEYGDIFPGARVVEAGAGSGALSSGLLQAIGQDGHLISFERREEFATIAKNNVALWFDGAHPSWDLRVGDFSNATDVCDAHSIDRVVLDMLAPWENLDTVWNILVPGGVFTCYVATVTQMSRLVDDMTNDGRFTNAYAFETISRPWHLDGLAVRPEHNIIGHTGFIVVARTLAEGSHIPVKKTGVTKAHEDLPGQWDDREDWDDSITGQRAISNRKLKRVIRDTTSKAQRFAQKDDE